MDSNMAYTIDDWVVHTHYGVGQIKRIEVKPIHGEDTKCFKVTTKDGTFWFPTTDDDNPRIRPVASKEIIHKVVKTLRRKATYLAGIQSPPRVARARISHSSSITTKRRLPSASN